MQLAAEHEAARLERPAHKLCRRTPSQKTVAALYDALLRADNVILRGVSFYLKAFLIWQHPFFMEEMGLNLYIALEAGLADIRRRMSAATGKDVSYQDVFDFVRATFSEGRGIG